MLPLRRRSRFDEPPTALERQLVPLASTMIASLATIVPVVASEPLLPPLGFMVFLGWRLLRNDVWPLWIGLPLGLWDDLFSGQPLGSAMCGWTIAMLAINALDQRLPFRGHEQDWAVATIAIAALLLFALGIARLTGGDTALYLLLPQILISALLFPLVARACAALDRWRTA